MNQRLLQLDALVYYVRFGGLTQAPRCIYQGNDLLSDLLLSLYQLH